MATVAAIAIMRDEALRRLTAAIERISAPLGVESVELPLFNRDRDYLHADQLRVLADWVEKIADAGRTPIVEAAAGVVYSTLTLAELKALADERGLDLAGATRKADIVSALEAADAARTEASAVVPICDDEPEQPVE